jgi:hypothetical protein
LWSYAWTVLFAFNFLLELFAAVGHGPLGGFETNWPRLLIASALGAFYVHFMMLMNVGVFYSLAGQQYCFLCC